MSDITDVFPQLLGVCDTHSVHIFFSPLPQLNSEFCFTYTLEACPLDQVLLMKRMWSKLPFLSLAMLSVTSCPLS